MIRSSFLTSARVANSKLAAKLAGDLIRVGSGQGIGVKASVRRTSITRSDRNLPAFIVIRMGWRSGAASTAAMLTAPITDRRARGIAPVGSENSFGDRAPRGLLFLALVNSFQEPASGIAKAFHSLSKSMFHDRIRTHGAFTWNEKVFPNPPKVLSRVK